MSRLKLLQINIEPIYNLSDINWQDDTLETGIGDIDGSDPTMKGYNKGYQMEPYKERFYASKTAAKEVIDISNSVDNYANEILSLWKEADGPLQNFFEGFTMNKFDNDTIKQIAEKIREKGYSVYPVLVDRRSRYAGYRNTDIQEFVDFQLSDSSLNAIEKIMNGQDDPIYNGPGTNEEATDRSDDIGVAPSLYEVTLCSRLKKKH